MGLWCIPQRLLSLLNLTLRAVFERDWECWRSSKCMCSRTYSWFGDILPDIQGWLASSDSGAPLPSRAPRYREPKDTAAHPCASNAVWSYNNTQWEHCSCLHGYSGENMHELQSLEKWVLFSGTSGPAAVSSFHAFCRDGSIIEECACAVPRVDPELANMYFHEVHLTFHFYNGRSNG